MDISTHQQHWGLKLYTCIHGNALKLGEYETDYDVVLVMEPLYHLTEEIDRLSLNLASAPPSASRLSQNLHRHKAGTREFYIAVGFRPLGRLSELWGEEHPCLIMVQYIA